MSPAMLNMTPEDYGGVDHQEIYFSSSTTYDKITVLWSTTLGDSITTTVTPAYRNRLARLVWQDGYTETITPTQGVYQIQLPSAASNAVGGKTVLLLEDDDFPEVFDDSDGDGIPDEVECPDMSDCPDSDGDGVPDYLDLDSDGDTILDSYEAICTKASGVVIGDGFPCDSDGDTIPDYLDLDSDGDGVFDLFEAGDQEPQTPPHEGAIVNGIPAFRDPNERYIPALPSVQGVEACHPFADFPDAGVLPWGFDRGVACGLEMIRTTLATAGITVTLEDPPVPAMLFATTPYPRPAGGAQTVLTTTTAPVTTPLAASFTTSHTVVSGNLQAAWTTDAWVAAQFATLTAPYAQLYDEHDTLLAAGPVQAAPAEGDAALALALGGDLTCTVDGRGALSFYAPATAGLGVGGTWDAYTASVAAPGAFGVGLQGASVTVNGQAFTGALTLVVSDTLTLHGAGHTVAPNFAAQVALTAQDAFVHLAAADAYDGYSGNLSISEHSAALDSVTLSGTYARRLAVAAVPAQSQVTPFETATFQATLSAVQGAVPDALPVTVTVVPPDGWTAALDASGQVAITPARAAAPGDYPVRLVAQATDDVVLLAGAVHTVTLQPYNGMQWTVAPDPLTTVPWGPALALPPSGGAGGGTNTGQAQIPGAAYLATLTNTSTVAHTFRVEVTPDGFPTAWIALGGAGRSTTTTLALAAGSVGRLGVYIAPVGLTSLPPAGTQYPFTVRAVAADAPALDQSAPAVFTMPAVPFNYLTAAPETLLATASVPATFDVTLTNVGNVNGTFTVQAVAPDGWVAGAPYSVSLAVGAHDTRTYTFIAAGARPGDTGIIRVQSPAPGSPYVQADTVNVRIVGPCTFEAAQSAQSAAALDDTALTVALDDLTMQLGRWEQDSANAGLRARVQAAVALLQAQVARYPQLDATAFAPLTATAVITDFCAPLEELDTDLGRLAAYRVSARFIPGYDAALLNTPITYTLRLQNHGTLTTTYRVNLQLNHLASQQIHNQQILHPGTTWLAVIAPGQIVTQPVVLLPASLGAWQLAAQVEAVGDAFIQATATAGLNVVDAFVKVLAVNANPAFVETGVSSTALAVYIANIANVPRAVTAQVAILAPDATPVWTDSVALALQVGAPRIYALGTVTTSGWAAGVYTITVDLQDTRGVTIPDGAGYGFLAVGQALEATHGVTPSLVAPGTVTVTTVITTESTHTEEPDDTGWLLYTPMPARANAPDGPSRGGRPPGLASLELQEPLTTTLGITRYEEGDPLFVYTGTWAIRSMAYASAGQARRSNVAGNAASLTFDGTWVSVGLGTGADAGYVEVFIDGVSQGILDTYRNGNSVTTYVYDSLSPATHTISLTVLGARNDWASNSFVYVDHIDVWDGTALPEGFFEQDDARVYLSTNWSTASIAAASGGTYIRGGSNAWFPFIGETVTFQALAYSGGGKASVLVDGQFLGYIDLYSAAAVTRTFSYGPFASGPHVLQVQAYRGTATVDGFRVPAEPPPTPVPPPTGIVRYEEDNLALRYNSVPFTQTAGTWGMVAASRLSDGYAARSNTVSDTVSLTFDGSWVSVGLGAGSDCGYAAVFINGALAEVVDTYRNVDSVMTRVYDGLPSGVNTISIVVRGERNAYASNSRVYVDYIEVWDGTALPDGFFEQDDARVRLSANWTTVNSTAASGETYIRGGSNAWFPFTGETVTFQALAYSSGGKAGVLVDGQFQGYVDLYSAVAVTRTFSYGPFTSGPHVLQVQAHRGNTTVDGFRVPAEPPPAPVPPPSGIVRYEEDDPALRYNGLPFTQTAITWSMRSVGHLSRGYAARSNTVSDTVSLTFDGTWASVGFGTGADCGHVEVFINGVSQGILDTYRNGNSVAMRVYDNLPPGVNTISIVVLGRKSDYSSNTYVYVDYIDVWDGEAIPDGFFEQDDARVRLSANWTTVNSTAASGGTYIRGGSNAWFPFTGETATFQALAYSSGGKAGVLVDGQFQGYVDLYSASLVTRTFSYGSFTPGPHVLQVQAHRGNATVDGFRTPAMGVSTPPTPIIRRVEEDDPNLRYNGHPFGKFPSGWEERTRDLVSDGYVYSSRTPGDVVILTLDSSWLVVGFHTRADSGMAQIRIGDVVSETVDLYAPAAGLLERFYTVPTGVHTITITVLTQRNPASSDGWVEFDYIDFWTGQESADTFYEAEWDVNVRTSHRWTEVANDLASGNAFLENGDNLWFGFTADSVSFHTFAAPDSPAVEVFIDGVSQGVVDPYFPALVPRVVNYTHLGPGPHILRIENLQNGRVDGFHTPVIPMPQEEVLLHLCVALDGSGSISAGEFDLMRRGLAATVRDRTTVPQNGALELSVVQFSSNAYVEILPTIIRDSATAEQVAHQIEMFTQKGGGTNMAAGIDLCAGLIVHSPQFSGASKRIINIVGDGEPTYPGPDPHQAAVDARIAAVAGGIDEVNFEAIGVSANTIAFLRDELVYPQPGYLAPPFIPEHGGFVIPVNNFADFEAAMRQKLQFVLETDVYHVDVEHSAPITDVIVLIDTIAPPSTHISTTGGQVQIAWQHVLTPNHRVETAMFQSRLPAMQPGEIRRVADGTLVRYTGTSGSGEISLPPLYVSAAHLLALMPFSRTTVAGNGAPYSVTLANPTTASATYTLTVSGLPADWVALPPTVTVAGAAAVTVPLHLTPPPDAEITAYTFAVNAATPTGGWDQAPGVLEVAEGFILALTPAQLTADYGATVTYTLTLSNAEPILREYTLQATGLASSSVQLPAMMSVPPGATRSVTVSVMAREPLGIHLLTVQASYTHAGTAVSAQASAGLAVQGEPGLTLALSPVQGVGGPDSPATYTVWVTNTGTFSDTYALNVSVPDGWAVQLWAHGAPAAQISLTPYVFNSAALQLLVTPPPGTPSGDYPLTVYAVATRAPALTAEVSGVATVAATGITVAISPPERVADPREPLTWNITLTNTSSVADTFTLTAGGVVVGGNAAWSINPVSLAPGASATVQLTSAPLDFVTPQSYPLSVVACAQSTPQVCNATTATVSFTEFAGVDVHLWPAAQTVSATLPAQYLMVVTNTGNIGTHYTLAATSIPPLDVLALDLADLYIPPHMTAQVLLTARTAQPGTYTLAVQADQGTFAATATAQLTVTTAIFNHPPVAVNDTFTTPMNVAITTPVLANDYDPDGDALTLDTVGPAGHGWVYRNPQDQLTYTPDTGFVGTDSFTYTLRDVHGSLAGATVTIQVTPVYDTPLVSLGPDRSVAEGSLITFTAAITDPDTPTGHTLHWDFGDGGTAGGTLTPTHVYADDGIYPVTLTVTDTTGLSGAGHLTVTVANVAPTLTAGPDRTVAVSETLAFNGVFTDPGVLDIHTIAWDFGDGITATGTLTPAHVYTAPGIYTATLVVADDDGGTGSDTLVITVTEQITPVYDTPLVSLGPDRNVAEGSPITLTVVITDPDTPTGHTLHWDFGDGGTADGTLTPTHVYADEGVYPVTLTVTDTTGLSGAGHLTVTVVNVAPTLTAGADRTAIVSETLTFSGVFTDPGVLDTHTIAWHFGDGITATGALTPTHAYTQPGVYTVTLTVVDNAGGVGSDTLVVTINASGPGAISGVIWNDLDGNGVQNGAETGLTGVYVMLFADDGDGVFEPEASDPGVTYTVTPDGGSYAFSDLAPGAYWVDVYEESAPAGYVRTTPAEDPLLVTLAAGEARTVDFGYRALSGSTCVTILRPGSAHEQVWDAYIWAASPAANSGNSTLLYSGLVGSGEKQSLLRFDLSALPENAVVDSAVLAVYFTTSKVQIVRMHQATATWQETAVTWNTFGGSYLDATEGYLVSLGTGFHAVDLTRLVRQWANGSAANYGVLLEQNSTAYDSYKSSEYSTASYRPRLQVCYHAAP